MLQGDEGDSRHYGKVKLKLTVETAGWLIGTCSLEVKLWLECTACIESTFEAGQ